MNASDRRLTVTNAIPGRVVVLSRGYRLGPGETVEWRGDRWRLVGVDAEMRENETKPTWRPPR